MRISDWSSDVCSSDLDALRGGIGLVGADDIDRALGAVEAEAHARADRDLALGWGRGQFGGGGARVPIAQFALTRLGFGRIGGERLFDSLHLVADQAKKIGRASCRERVCQYV